MRELLGASPTKKIDFLGRKGALTIRKLTGAEVKGFLAFLRNDSKEIDEESRGTAIQNYIIRVGVVGATDLTDDELDGFPFDELSKVAKEVLIYSGINLEANQGNAEKS